MLHIYYLYVLLYVFYTSVKETRKRKAKSKRQDVDKITPTSTRTDSHLWGQENHPTTARATRVCFLIGILELWPWWLATQTVTASQLIPTRSRLCPLRNSLGAQLLKQSNSYLSSAKRGDCNLPMAQRRAFLEYSDIHNVWLSWCPLLEKQV